MFFEFRHKGGVILVRRTVKLMAAIINLMYESMHGASALGPEWDGHIGSTPDRTREIQAKHGLVYMSAEDIPGYFSYDLELDLDEV